MQGGSMSLAGAQQRFKDSVWKLGSQRVSLDSQNL